FSGLDCYALQKLTHVGTLEKRCEKEEVSRENYDYFKLALQWPGTFCRKTRRCCSSNGCCRGSNSPAEFTIHGLWPDYNDGTWPSCSSGKRFDVKEISTLHDDLNKYWPSLSCRSSSNCHGGKGLFWEHEWENHGTCSSAVTGNEYDYFVMALNMYYHYNVSEVLINAGYVASDFVSFSYLNPEPQTLLAELNQRMAPQFGKLNKSLIDLVDQYSMVSFFPLDLRKESSIQYMLSQIDNCIQYGEDADVKVKDFDPDDD
ncbi:ribonuclease 2-like, partial [Primulina tabacum]|uniref:ribonuclease 2-like n=1 Tax=Primulina tabacum TaxID=48773 RepID=UPI003F59AC61